MDAIHFQKQPRALPGSKLSILDLPDEVLLKINVPLRDLLSLALVNKRFHEVFVQKLYSSVEVKRRMIGTTPAVISFLRTILSVPELAAHAKSLQLIDWLWTLDLSTRVFQMDQTNALVPNAEFSTTTRPRHAWATITDFTNFLLSNLPNLINLSLCRNAAECWQSAVLPKLRAVDVKNSVVGFAEFARFLTLPTLEKLSIRCIPSNVHHPEFLIEDLRSIHPRNCKIKDLYVEEMEFDKMPTDVFEAFLKVFVCLRRFRWYRKKPLSVAWENGLQHALSPFKKTLNVLILDVFYPPSLQGPENVMQEPLLDLSTFPQLRILHISPGLLIRSYIPKKSIFSLPGRRRKIGQYQPLTAISDVLPKSVAILTLQATSMPSLCHRDTRPAQ
jgi:hypothetical protein